MTYHSVSDAAIVERVRERYSSTMEALKVFGFEELCFYKEALFPMSGVLLFPVFLLMLAAKEVVTIHNPLRIVAFYPLLVSRDYGTYAHVFSWGVKFYTTLVDGTGIISMNFSSFPTIIDDKRKFYKFSSSSSIPDAWALHQQVINQLRAEGRPTLAQVCFEAFVALSLRENRRWR